MPKKVKKSTPPKNNKKDTDISVSKNSAGTKVHQPAEHTNIISEIDKKANKNVKIEWNTAFYIKENGEKVVYTKLWSIKKRSFKKDKFQTDYQFEPKWQHKQYETVLDDVQLGKKDKGVIAKMEGKDFYDGKQRDLFIETALYEKVFKRHWPINHKNLIETANNPDIKIINRWWQEWNINYIKKIPWTNKGLIVGIRRENWATFLTHFEPKNDIADFIAKEKAKGGVIVEGEKSGKIPVPKKPLSAIAEVKKGMKDKKVRLQEEKKSTTPPTPKKAEIHKKITQEQAKQTVRKYFKEDEIGVEFVENISTKKGQRALGKYQNKMISFAKNPKKSTPEHEVFHAYFDVALGKKRKAELLEQIKKDKNIKDNVQAEEILADSFAEFAIGRENASLSMKVRNKIKDLWEKFKSFFGKEDKVYKVFKELEEIGQGKRKLEIKNKKGLKEERYMIDDNWKMLQDFSKWFKYLQKRIKKEYDNEDLRSKITTYHEKAYKEVQNKPAYTTKNIANIKWVKKEYTSVDIYESDIGYRNINWYLRWKGYNSREITKKAIEWTIDALDNSFIKSSENMRLYRGLQSWWTGNRIVAKIKNGELKVWDTIENFDKAYTSTSIAPSRANEFDGDVFYVIDVPKWNDILPIKWSHLNWKEKEILLSKNLKPKVKNIQEMDLNWFGVTKYIIHIEI